MRPGRRDLPAHDARGRRDPAAGGIVLVLSETDRIRGIRPDELLLVAQPGVTVATVQAAAGEHGLLYPSDPGVAATATIGGNVATCAGGLRALKYGVTRDYVLGVEAVLADGEIVRCGGPGGVDAGGYDLSRLLCGSEGTPAVITEVTVRLVPGVLRVARGHRPRRRPASSWCRSSR